jgi:exopolyphosphatase/guanosine-5'-triphosphate,3'-diphosphate pyrophosphatase
MVKAMRAFKLLMKVHGVSHYQAFATSALREANNSIEVIDHVKKKAGIKIEIIDGRKEAEVISYSKLSEFLNSQKTFLFVDVGGGSTEFTIIDEGKRISSKSFKIGTVRLINDLVDDRVWKAIQGWIEKNAKPYRKITLIGSGGNINKLFKLSNIKEGKPLSLIKLNQIYLELESLTYEERLLKFELNPDRADVIIPAAKIYLKSLEWSGGQKIYVPKFGLSDGMIKYMYKNKKKRSNRAWFLFFLMQPSAWPHTPITLPISGLRISHPHHIFWLILKTGCSDVLLRSSISYKTS